MALKFVSASTDKVDHGSSLTPGSTGTILFWYKPTSTVGNRVFFIKQTAGDLECYRESADGTIFSFFVERGTVNTGVLSTTGQLVAGEWAFLVYAYDLNANSTVLYKGSLSAIAVDVTSGTSAQGSGTFTAPTGALRIGGNGVSVSTADCEIAYVQIVNGRKLTLGEIRTLQFQPHFVPDTALFSHYGFNGTGTQADWSGNVNNGTVTGATVSAHVPLGPPFGFDSDLALWVTPSPAPLGWFDPDLRSDAWF